MNDFSEFPQVAQYYFNYLITVNGKSPLTVSGYALDLRLFFRFLKMHRGAVSGSTDFDEICINDIDIDFLNHRQRSLCIFSLLYNSQKKQFNLSCKKSCCC